MLCGARTKTGGRCKQPVPAGWKRCRNHGGASTGPTVLKARAHLQPARAAWVQRQHAEGHKARLGFAVTPLAAIRQLRGMSAEERFEAMVDALIETLPAAPTDRPIEQWTPAELLNDGTRLGLLRLREFVCEPVDRASDAKLQRIVLDAAVAHVRAMTTVQVAALQARQDRGLDKLKAAIAAHRKAEKESAESEGG